MKTNAYPIALCLGLFFAMIALSGCTTTESGKDVVQQAPVEIVKGMSAEDLVAAIGEPDVVRPSEPEVEGTEIWVYKKRSVSQSLVLSGTKETPYFDPITGQYRPIIDNEYSNETRRFLEETQFLMVDGVMTAWKVVRDEKVNLQK